jgi:hypothetical protein
MSENDRPKTFMRMHDGTLIDTETGKRVVSTEINHAFADTNESQRLKNARAKASFGEGRRRYLDDLPLPADQSRAVALVAAYTLFGLNTADIAFIAKTGVEIVEQIKLTKGFVEFIDAMLANVREHDRDKVRKKINASALKAAEKITELVGSPDEKVSLSAAKDVLDRHAYTSAPNGGSNNVGGLVIRIIDDRDNPAAKVDVEFG